MPAMITQEMIDGTGPQKLIQLARAKAVRDKFTQQELQKAPPAPNEVVQPVPAPESAVPPPAQAPSTYDPLTSIRTPPQTQAKAAGAPQFTAASSTDTVAAPVSDQWTATGKTDSFGSFFNKRQGTDALTAFGAAMLKAPNFMVGLADGALAVNQVDRENRMPTPQEIARANIKAKMANGTIGAPTVKTVQPGYDENGNYVTQSVMSDNTSVFRDANNNILPNGVAGFRRAQDSGLAQRGKDTEKYLTASRDRADVAQQNMPTYDTLLATGSNANAGSGAIEGALRTMASIAGVDLGDASLSDQQVFTKASRQLELQLAQTQKGLGQFTEMERKIVQEAIPNLNTQTATIFRVATQMKLRDQLDVELYNDYMDLPPSKRGDFEDYAYEKRKEQRQTYKERYAELVAQELDLHPEYKGLSGTPSASPSSGGPTVLKYDANGDLIQ